MTAGTVTGERIETYVLSGLGNVFTVGAAGQSVNTGSGVQILWISPL